MFFTVATKTDSAIMKAALVDLDSSLLFITALFLLLFYILNKTFIQKMLDVFDRRHALTDGARDAADRAVRDAEERIQSYEVQVGTARRSGVEEQKRLRAEGVARERELLDSVRKEAEAKVNAGIVSLQKQSDEARTAMEPEIRRLAEVMAQRIVGGA